MGIWNDRLREEAPVMMKLLGHTNLMTGDNNWRATLQQLQA